MDARPRGLSRRRLLAGGAAAAGLAALSACGAGPQAEGDAFGPPVGAISLLTPIFQGTDGRRLLEQRVLPAFQRRYPEVQVSVDYTDYDVLDAKITTALTSGVSPDVIMLGVGWVEPFAARGVLAELVTPPGVPSLASDFSEQVVSSCRYDGRLYALPVVLDARFGIYRKDAFARAGLTRPPATMDELRGYAIELTERQGDRLVRTGLDFQTLDVRQMFETVLFAFGGSLFDNGRPAFHRPEGVAALRWLADLQRRDRVIDPGFSSSKTMSTPVNDGRAAMAIGHNNWYLKLLASHPEAKDVVAPFLLNSQQPSMFAGGTLVSVSAASRHPAAAQALARYLAGADVSLTASEQRGNVPAPDATRDSAYVKGNPFVRFALANMSHARPEGGSPAWLRVRSEVQATVESALLGRQSPQAALDTLAETADAALADFGPG
jgi:multiple sugar transport system substrate-binding protein